MSARQKGTLAKGLLQHSINISISHFKPIWCQITQNVPKRENSKKKGRKTENIKKNIHTATNSWVPAVLTKKAQDRGRVKTCQTHAHPLKSPDLRGPSPQVGLLVIRLLSSWVRRERSPASIVPWLAALLGWDTGSWGCWGRSLLCQDKAWPALAHTHTHSSQNVQRPQYLQALATSSFCLPIYYSTLQNTFNTKNTTQVLFLLNLHCCYTCPVDPSVANAATAGRRSSSLGLFCTYPSGIYLEVIAAFQ